MVKKKMLKTLEVLLAVVIAVAALCALAIPVAAYEVPNVSGAKWYEPTYGWDGIRVWYRGDIYESTLPPLTSSVQAVDIMDFGDLVIYFGMYGSSTAASLGFWYTDTNNTGALTLTVELFMNDYHPVVPRETHAFEGFDDNSLDLPQTGNLMMSQKYIEARTASSTQGYTLLQKTNYYDALHWNFSQLVEMNTLNRENLLTSVMVQANYHFSGKMYNNDTWEINLNTRLRSTYDAALYQTIPTSYPFQPTYDQVNFNGVSEFLSQSVSPFFNFEIFPGFTIGGVIGVMMAVLIVIIFLKIFAGG